MVCYLVTVAPYGMIDSIDNPHTNSLKWIANKKSHKGAKLDVLKWLEQMI